MCIDPTKIDRPLETCEALVAEQKAKILQLEEDLQQQRELCQKLEAQLKAVENAGFSGSVTESDITEDDRIQLIVSLEKSQEMYRTLIKHYPNGSVFLFDRDLRYTLVDGQGLAAVGLSKEQLEGKTLWEVSPPEDLPL
ncbi:MAG TPA: PAS domain-containing protein, partial [Microcoleus sp.]|nr:PAS domain-containing protein [Microcoleus sp.]